MTSEGGQSARTQISRRRALGRGALLLGGGVAAASRIPSALGAPRRRAVYKLDPEWGSGPACGPDPHKVSRCHACRACHRHAKNKLFATEAAIVRAHPYCNCKIKKRFLPHATWVALFGPPSRIRRKEVDKRWPWVRRILNRR